MKEIVRRIFGDEAAEDPDIVNLYESVNKDVANDVPMLFELIELQNKYIKLLRDELNSNTTFHHVHGINRDPEKVKKGKELREQIKLLKNEISID